jgi:di/tricarboxylate transporter
MDLAIVSLVLLVVVIAIGFKKKVNLGILAIFVAVLFGAVLGVKDSEIIKGFSSNLFIMLLGITLLCSIAEVNGSVTLFAKKCTALVGNKTWLAPIMIWFIGALISGAGPGSIPSLGIVCAIAAPFGIATGYDPIMMCAIGEAGIFFGRFTPITTDCSVISAYAFPQGYTQFFGSLMKIALFISIVESIAIFVAFKGYKVKSDVVKEKEELPPFSKSQIMTLLGFGVLIVTVLGLRKNVGLVGFSVSSILILLGAVNEKKAIAKVPWGTLVMITGVGMLMKLVVKAGGINLLVNALSSIMTPGTAAAITGAMAGVMSWFSSATGVVFPTMIPMVSGLVENMGGQVNPNVLISMISICAAYAGLSPASTGGALILAASAGDSEVSAEKESYLFAKMFAVSAGALLIIVLLAFTGVMDVLA